MVLVREINQSRASSQVGDRLGRLGLAIPNTAGETSVPDIQAGESKTVAPQPPSTPKPAPPDPKSPPPRLRPVGESSSIQMYDLPLMTRPPNFLAPPKAVPVISRSFTSRTVRSQFATVIAQSFSTSISASSSSVSSGFTPQSSPVRYVPGLSPITHRPKLLSVANIHPHLLVRPIQTRTGVIRPALPVDYPMSRASAPSSPLRTTVDGVRLGIAPTSILALTRHEIAIPAAFSPPSLSFSWVRSRTRSGYLST